MMWLRRRPKTIAAEQMALLVPQMLFFLIMGLFVRLAAVERLLLEQPYVLQRLLEERFDAFQRSLIRAIQDINMIRTTVHSEVKERQATLLSGGYQHPRLNISDGFPQTGGSTRMVKLLFDVKRLEDPLYTGSLVQWQNGANAKVAIFENDSQITRGDLSNLQIEILSVHDDFFTERGLANFTKEEFNKQMYMCKGKESVLKTVNLTNGEAYLGSFFFTESSYGKRLRLAARVKCQDRAVMVQEAISYSFVIKDRRSKSNKKSHSPSKEEGIHCLKKIFLKGKRYSDLVRNNITNVKHLMRHYHIDPNGLKKLTGMKNEDWNIMIEHAATSDPGDEIYSYRVAEENTVLFFNDFFDFVGMSVFGSYAPYHTHDHNLFPQRIVNNWKKSAHTKFQDLEKSGSLIPDYAMINGCPFPVSPNNDGSPSIQARQTLDHQTAAEGLGYPFQQQSVLQVSSYNDAGLATQAKQPLQQYPHEQNMHQESGQEGLFMQLSWAASRLRQGWLGRDKQQNGTSYSLSEGNILNVQGFGSVQPTIVSHNTATVRVANLSMQHNGYVSTSTPDPAGTSCPVTDGVIPQGSLSNDLFLNVLSQIDSPESYEHVANQTMINEPVDFNDQFHSHENDGYNFDPSI
ncbi:hypothetical protein GUJ93_ZPchr0013g36661 [Zizania palustris]|uniref:Calmodulin-binding protein n=1 Tax=Zizania palustris TaxID=103762 RepID=A0A8J5WZ66_ZIZPA|nr:hypothetical protein GUJ93_ZPchr0013g36661 [Zizania palustris]